MDVFVVDADVCGVADVVFSDFDFDLASSFAFVCVGKTDGCGVCVAKSVSSFCGFSTIPNLRARDRT